MARDRASRHQVVPAHDGDVVHDIVGGDEHGRNLGLDRGLEERPLAPRRLGHDEAVDAAAADPVEHDA